MKILKLIMDLLTGVVYLCIAGYLAIAAPLLLGYHPVVVLSGSMEPTYHVGSVIYYKEAQFEEIEAGDPITFTSGDGGVMVTHRVVEKDEAARAFGTEGDANGSRDPGMVSYANVLGKASPFCIPYAGYYVSLGRQPVFIITIAGVIVASILFDKLYETVRKDKTGAGGAAEKQDPESVQADGKKTE